MSAGLASAKDSLSAQSSAIMALPSLVVSRWPIVITFAVVNTLSAMATNAIYSTGMVRGSVGDSLVRGFTQVVTLTTWDVAKSM